MVVTVSHGGYVKRSPVSEYRAQKRGGRGVTGASSKDEDFVAQLFVAETHDTVLVFTSQGRVFQKRVYQLPEGNRASRGKALVNFLELKENEKVISMLPVKAIEADKFLMFSTKRGIVKRTSLEQFGNIRSTGIIALSIDEGDALVGVRLTDGKHDIVLSTKDGRAIRFPETKLRPMGRSARGVRGINVGESGSVVAIETVPEGTPATLLTVSERGYGKRTPVGDYPVKGRGGKGVITIKTTDRNGKVVSCRLVKDDEDLMLITSEGKVIRMPIKGIPTLGRNTAGVRLIRVEEGETVVSVDSLAEADESTAEVAAPVEVLAGEEDLGDESPDDDETDGEEDGAVEGAVEGEETVPNEDE
jgi:DNA gyrase subunit A